MRAFRDSKAVMRAPRIQLKAEASMPRPTRTGGGEAPSADALTPIAGVSLDCYAAVVRGMTACNSDPSVLPGIAAEHGIAVDAWRQAHAGWNARIRTDSAVARRFSDIYYGAVCSD